MRVMVIVKATPESEAQSMTTEQMTKLFGTGTVSSQDVDALVTQESQARLALMRERLATALEVRNVLTPAQIQRAATIRSGMKELHAQMRQLLGKQD